MEWPMHDGGAGTGGGDVLGLSAQTHILLVSRPT